MNPIRLLPFVLALAAPALADITIEKSEAGAVVKIDGHLFTEYVTLSENKPILWPIIGPTGKKMSRDYPMVKTEGEKHDHPHHRSLWFTHMEVNGWNFWAEKASVSDPKKASAAAAKIGLTKHREFAKLEGGKDSGIIVTLNDWIAPDGKKQLEDERRITFSTAENARIIDFDIDLKATEGDVEWGDNKDGTFGIRIPTSMDLKQEQKGAETGHIATSEGLKDADAWGKAARWVDYSGPVQGEQLGIAILNHPTSFRYPTTWHVRDYGLFCANPFGWQDFNKESEPGTYKQEKGTTLKFRYRLIFHTGDEKTGKIAEAFAAYEKAEK
jgi:hypothetical protein